MTDWTLEQIPQRIQSKGRPPAFPALVDKHHSVALEVFARSDEAQTQHVQGVRQLLWLTLEKPARQAARKLPLKNITELQYAPLGNVKAMRMDLVHGAFNDVVATLDLMVHTRDAFAALQQTLLQRLFKAAVERLLLAEPIIATRAEAGQWLEPERPGRSSASYADMHSQLACLLHAGFLRDLPHTRLAHYPRYLAALKIRAERLRLDPGKDHRHLQSIQPYWQAYLAYREAHGVNASGERLHWLLEEWRVSLFAQALKTAEPVSEKRVRQALEQLEVKRKQA